MEAIASTRAAGPPAPAAWRANLATIAALMVRAKNELVRVPGAAIPGVLAPTIFFLGLNGVFGGLIHLRGFNVDSYESFIVPVSMLQGAGFTGAAAGVNLARDYEQGWVDRLLVSPAPRWVLLAGNVLAASARALIPATFVLAIAFVLGAQWPGVDGLVICYLMVAAMAAVAACWGSMLALHYKSQSAAPLMQAGMMGLILLTPAYAPKALLQPWLEKVATINPVSHVVEAARQGFVGSVTWADTWPGLLALAGLLAVLGSLALREMRRTNA
jgi:ABC-2 type transport system permease protein